MVKRIISVVLLICLCLSLSSCAQLDELRASTAYEAPGGITFRGANYMSIGERASKIGFLKADSIYVANQDVPILLVPIFTNQNRTVSKDLSVIKGNQLYVKDGEVERINALLETEFTQYAAHYYNEYEKKYDLWLLDSEFCDMINKTIATATPKEFDKADDDYRYITQIYDCDKDAVFTKSTYILYQDIQTKNYFLTTDPKDSDEMILDIPPVYNSLVTSYSQSMF